MSNFEVGDKVIFGRTRGEKTRGEVVKVNPVKLKVKQLEARGGYPVGTVWTVPPSLCTLGETPNTPVVAPTAPKRPASKRPEAAIMADVRRVFAELSPENLTCDGELSAREVSSRRAALTRKLRALEAEAGRRFDESDVYGYRA